jgi:glutamate/tyrosine decarboxylase-like PLP-dependent enzyme
MLSASPVPDQRAQASASSAPIETVLERATEIAIGYLSQNDQPNTKVNPNASAQMISEAISLDPSHAGRPIEDVLDEVTRVLELSPRTGHPGWCNQLFAGYDVAGIVGEWMSTLLNSTMATYESTPVATVIERAMIDKMCQFAGFECGEGIFTPGGSMSNLMAVLAARLRMVPESNERGIGAEPLAVFASSECHYSIRRAAMIAGLGTRAAREVDVDHEGRMMPDALVRAMDEAERDGFKPMLVCATAGTTVKAAYDPINEIADITEERGLWLHVDGAYGASALLSPRHRALLDGISRADSLTWCPHKMMGIPLVCSALLVKEAGWLARCNTSGAQYIFHDDQPIAQHDMGEMSLQCGRRMDAVKLWLAWQHHGDNGYATRIDTMFDLAQRFAEMVRQRPGFELARDPMGCNVVFHHVPSALRQSELTRDQLGLLTKRLRTRVLVRGRVMVNYAPVDGIATFRMFLGNPRLTEADLGLYLDEIEAAGAEIAVDSLDGPPR